MNTKQFASLLNKQVGKRYIFGAEVKMSDPNPKAFDCSELVQWSFHQAGAKIVDGSANQYRATVAIDRADLKVGDLFFLKNSRGVVHHVGIYVGGGMFVEAKGRLFGVVRSTLANVVKRGGIFRRYTDLHLTKPPAPVTASTRTYKVDLNDHTSHLRVRKGAGMKYAVKSSLRHGETVTGHEVVHGYRRITRPVNGWVAASKLKVVK